MYRWRSVSLGLLLVAVGACGSATSFTSTQVVTLPTATAVAATTAARPSGSPTATLPGPPGAVSTVVPTRDASTTPSDAPVAAQPNGPIPDGWKVYRGPKELPIVIAYPPDWTVDDSALPDQYVVYINGRSGNETFEISGSPQQSGATIDLLRDELFRQKSESCEQKGIEYTAYRQISDVPFALLGATCEMSGELLYLYLGSGIKGGDEWSIAMRTSYGRKGVVVKDYFDPMLASLKIYAPLIP
jgi:hypothetical protein